MLMTKQPTCIYRLILDFGFVSVSETLSKIIPQRRTKHTAPVSTNVWYLG
jgi:hypothetical protein